MTGRAVPVVARHHADGFLSVLVRLERDERVVHDRADQRLGVGEQELADVDVVDEPVLAVDDEDPVDSFRVVAEPADVLERLGDGPVGADAHVVGRHESPDRVGRVAEDCLGLATGRGAERRDQALGDLGGQFVEHAGAVVGVERFDGLARADVAQLFDEVALEVAVELGEHIARLVAGQEPEADRGLLKRKIRK